MYDPEAGGYICRRDQLVRHVPVASAPGPRQVRLPLRILGVVSSPSGMDRLNAAAEKDNPTRALARPASRGLAELGSGRDQGRAAACHLQSLRPGGTGP